MFEFPVRLLVDCFAVMFLESSDLNLLPKTSFSLHICSQAAEFSE